MEEVFECFRLASGLAKEDEARQVSALLYCMGDQADSVLMSTKIATEDRLKYNSVMSKFDEYFKVRRNVILERARFNQHNQLAGESVEQYITVLYTLVETCEHGNLTEELLRDRLVVGIRDSSLSERLQMDPELTLEKAKRIAHQRESIKDHHQQLSGIMGDQITIDYVNQAVMRSHVNDVAKTTSLMTNSQLEMPLVSSVIAKATSLPNACQIQPLPVSLQWRPS